MNKFDESLLTPAQAVERYGNHLVGDASHPGQHGVQKLLRERLIKEVDDSLQRPPDNRHRAAAR